MKSAFPLANACAQAIVRQNVILRCLVVFSIAQQIMSFNHNTSTQEPNPPLLPWPYGF